MAANFIICDWHCVGVFFFFMCLLTLPINQIDRATVVLCEVEQNFLNAPWRKILHAKRVTRKSIGKKKTKNVILEWSTSNFLGPMHYNKRKFDTPLVNLLKINKTGKVLDLLPMRSHCLTFRTETFLTRCNES